MFSRCRPSGKSPQLSSRLPALRSASQPVYLPLGSLARQFACRPAHRTACLLPFSPVGGFGMASQKPGQHMAFAAVQESRHCQGAVRHLRRTRRRDRRGQPREGKSAPCKPAVGQTGVPESIESRREGTKTRSHHQTRIWRATRLQSGSEDPSVRKCTVRNENTDRIPIILGGSAWI